MASAVPEGSVAAGSMLKPESCAKMLSGMIATIHGQLSLQAKPALLMVERTTCPKAAVTGKVRILVSLRIRDRFHPSGSCVQGLSRRCDQRSET